MPPEMSFKVGPDGTLRLAQGVGSPVRATGTPSGFAPMYGQGGLFGIVGIDPVLINACVNPIGFEGYLTWRGTNVLTPMYDALTFIGSSGYGQSGLCADCGTPSFKECVQSAVLGRICQMTNEHAFDQLGLTMHEGQPPRVSIFGNITAPDGTVIIPQGQPITDRFTLELMGVAYNLRRRLGRMLWVGNPANNLGGYQEFNGFQRLINTGKFDLFTNVACDGLDSYVGNYANNVVGVAGAPNIVNMISGLIRSIRYRVAGAGLDESSMQHYIVMHPRHWDMISNIWFCDYGIVCANTNISNESMILDIAARRDELLRTRMLPVDGILYPVVLDNQIPNTPSPYGTTTRFCGPIFGITTVIEGETITWGEYQDFSRTAAAEIAYFQQMYGMVPISITDGGRFMHAPTTEGGFCFDARLLTKPRILMKMPQTSWRLDNVCTVPLGDYADVTGSGGLYERDGGLYSKPYMGMYGEGTPGDGGEFEWSGD
jgi:hypothetical protein